MAASIRHKFVSTVPDGPATGVVRPSNWNDEHDVDGLELALGDPVADGYVLVSSAAGARSWVASSRNDKRLHWFMQ